MNTAKLVTGCFALAFIAGCHGPVTKGEVEIKKHLMVNTCLETAEGRCRSWGATLVPALAYSANVDARSVIEIPSNIYKHEMFLTLRNTELAAPIKITIPLEHYREKPLQLPWEGGSLTLAATQVHQNFDVRIDIAKSMHEEIREVNNPCDLFGWAEKYTVKEQVATRDILFTLVDPKNGDSLGNFRTAKVNVESQEILADNGVRCPSF